MTYLKVAAAGALLALSMGGITAASAQTTIVRYVNAYPAGAYDGQYRNYYQPRHCLRFDNKSLLYEGDEAEDAFDRAAALGNRCFANVWRLNQGVTILPFPRSDPLNDKDYYFLTSEQRKLMFGTSDVP